MATVKQSSPSRHRALYEITSILGTREVEAATAAELKEAMTPLLPGLDPRAIAMTAHMVVVEGAALATSTWSVRIIARVLVQPVAAPQIHGDREAGRKRPKRRPAAALPREEGEAMGDTVFGELLI